ncbi:uncharacterized protein TRAVEDRAFT_129292 [Trametes versicolor FP-101664 SS1]|uniref:uncharacterized protein n=1 Tax=Trametes versicolor (strain FP-101664) TaxID=717944 RepID=UPI0004623750|nr:uncharacterized protein TRAVEDRAFT_129292 [Trametes versicolor FP-101664 SS1]EIW55757.1 hypothetical protein TRAVEDRAFT_129292 [Trametes versicolor FP-101664 SS1]
MLTLAPTFACRRASPRLIHEFQHIAQRQFTTSPPQTLSDATTAAPATPTGLTGTAPYHTALVLLHTHAPPAEYPARSRSPLWRALTMKARGWGGTVNFVWSPELRPLPGYTGLGEDKAADDLGREAYTASVFSHAHRYGRLEIPEVSLANLDEIDESLRKLVLGDASGSSGGRKLAQEEGEALDRRLHLYVCTHGSRDCRCGEGGVAVARALRRELDKRGICPKDVVLGQVAHVGGHKYAANVLVYPYGDWLGNVQDFDVPHLLDEILAAHAARQQQPTQSATNAQELPPLSPVFWRGRMGLDKDEQIALLSRTT